MDSEKRMVTRKAFLARVVLPAFVVLAANGVDGLSAADRACGEKRDISVQALDEMTWRQLNAIQQSIADGEYAEAAEDLQKLLARSRRDAYLEAVVNQVLAQVEWSRENYSAALGYFEAAVALDTLPDQAHFSLMYQIAQIHYMQGQYEEALHRLDTWFCASPAEKVTSAAYVLKASLLLQQEDYAGSLAAIGTAIRMDADPRESWYQLKLAAQHELQQYAQAAKTLETMVARWPGEKTYWLQLAQIYFRLEQDQNSLATLALAYRMGLLDEQSDLLYLADLYVHSGLPFKAAGVLETGIADGIVESNQQHWTRVAEAWYAAEELEKALVAFEQAGKAAVTGATDLRRAYILIELERWPAALESLDRALGKGGMEEWRAGEAHLLRGMARFNLGNRDGAVADWNEAARYEKTREAAEQWMNHLDDERRRRAS